QPRRDRPAGRSAGTPVCLDYGHPIVLADRCPSRATRGPVASGLRADVGTVEAMSEIAVGSMGDRERWKQHAGSFGRVAADYDAARPSYPPDAVAWLTGPPPLDVIDPGAGTGKLTELLVVAGH